MPLKKTPFIIILSLIFGTMLLNLNKVPIAWIDEVMNIEPAWQFLQGNGFIGKMWPHAGAEKAFLAYLPLTSFIHIIDLTIFPAEIFYTRILWLIFLGISCIFMFKYIVARYMTVEAIIYFIVCIYVLDEGINNSLRNGRVEMPAIAIMSALFYLAIRNKRPSIQAILISLLLISHPGFYPIALLFCINLLTKKASTLKRVQYVFSIGFFPVLYLLLADFNFQNIYQQLVLHGQEHDQTAVQGNIFYLHFVERFLPIYKYQPYMLLLNLIMHVSCLYSIIFRWNPRHQLLEWSYLFTSIFWFFSLAPFYRYTSVLSFLMFLHLPSLVQRIFSLFGYLKFSLKTGNKVQLSLMFALLFIISIPFGIRHFYTFKQWPERNEYKVYSWLESSMQHQTNKKNLIIDEAIGFYYTMNHNKECEFTLPYALHKYKLEDYEHVYYLSFRREPTLSSLISTYQVPEHKEVLGIGKKILTYHGLKLYEIKSKEALEEIKRK
jgi:hypothetical protein